MCTKANIRICSVPGCNHITHNHRLLCDEHLGLHVDPRDYSRDDQTIVSLDATATAAFVRINELNQPRTWNNISHSEFNSDLDKAAKVISKRTGISYDEIIKYSAEKINNYYTHNDYYNRKSSSRSESIDWRNS